ncbi:MAG: MBL fold metallo-hydrolase [Chloroflexi bacterium]|nr:MBL fold metallo-hydrolase [Chloroflexota bacterium]MBT3668709.1 MBL fold metallo-hydrolase [Chloroflexota bacterium]MBT4001789.1 MBL fold metallo-hydrolase [Chloroflexota bacterium]MBT4305410.1 MBL fold metallo-hydrolase [Chloroflexota bacterium]MBT4532556.1 MBL fold metallo-hydrolase [Chloroflexota bacterium]
MIHRERVADNVYSFQSNNYANVNAGVIIGPDMAIVVDTLPFPEETAAMRDFIEREIQVPVRYLINTHYHADHTWGNYFFPQAKIVAHSLCYQYLEEIAIPALEEAKKGNSVFKNTKIVLPDITFSEGDIGLQIGKKNLRLFQLPGHSPDNIAIVIEEDRVMFSGDTIMPVPYIVDGDIDLTISSLKEIAKMGLENIVQGHGDIILRGEVGSMAKSNIDYLIEMRKVVRKANKRKYPLDVIEESDVESCGKSRVLLGGLAEQLHQNNMIALYEKMYNEKPIASEEYFEG